jgi:hypothetical protein
MITSWDWSISWQTLTVFVTLITLASIIAGAWVVGFNMGVNHMISRLNKAARNRGLDREEVKERKK